MHPPLRIIITVAALLGAGLGTAQDKKPDKPPVHTPDPVTRNASVQIDGEEVDYKVTTAKLVLKKDNGDPRASVFHVSYERTGVKRPKDRPVVFAFNGGPGSSAVWLHLGALGPRLVPTSPNGTRPLAPPHRVRPNPHSILDVADLVFIDPVSTGYSRPEKDAKPSEFHGVQGDIESVGDFIRRWVTEHGRWGSPKFLLGESYGGVRAAGLADYLQSRYGMTLNGVVLLSSLLDFRTLRNAQGDDLMYSVYLPAYTAVAHYHKRIKGDRDQLVKQARDFAFGDYASALLQGTTVNDKQRERLAKRLSELTGIHPSIFLETDLRLNASRFRKELLRRDNLVLGRFDARVAWPSGDEAADTARYDPSFAVAYGAFSTAMLDYLTEQLGWEEESPYEILTGKVGPWDWGADNSYVNLTNRLVNAMRENPTLRILVLCGHTDLATPPDGIEYSFRHMFALPDAGHDAVAFKYYDAGHMFYLNEPDLAKLRTDLVEFIAPPEPTHD